MGLLRLEFVLWSGTIIIIIWWAFGMNKIKIKNGGKNTPHLRKHLQKTPPPMIFIPLSIILQNSKFMSTEFEIDTSWSTFNRPDQNWDRSRNQIGKSWYPRFILKLRTTLFLCMHKTWEVTGKDDEFVEWWTILLVFSCGLWFSVLFLLEIMFYCRLHLLYSQGEVLHLCS